jgi:hypothetical protein
MIFVEILSFHHTAIKNFHDVIRTGMMIELAVPASRVRAGPSDIRRDGHTTPCDSKAAPPVQSTERKATLPQSKTFIEPLR